MGEYEIEDLEDAEKKGYALGFAAATMIFRSALGRIPQEVAKGVIPDFEAAVWTSFELSAEAARAQADFYYEGNLKATKELKQLPNNQAI